VCHCPLNLVFLSSFASSCVVSWSRVLCDTDKATILFDMTMLPPNHPGSQDQHPDAAGEGDGDGRAAGAGAEPRRGGEPLRRQGLQTDAGRAAQSWTGESVFLSTFFVSFRLVFFNIQRFSVFFVPSSVVKLWCTFTASSLTPPPDTNTHGLLHPTGGRRAARGHAGAAGRGAPRLVPRRHREAQAEKGHGRPDLVAAKRLNKKDMDKWTGHAVKFVDEVAVFLLVQLTDTSGPSATPTRRRGERWRRASLSLAQFSPLWLLACLWPT